MGELLDVLQCEGFDVARGRLGENVLTVGVDLLALPTGARLRLGDAAIVEVTGLRNPFAQLNDVGPGLMTRPIERREDGTLDRKAGVMGIVVAGGEVRRDDAIAIELAPGPHRPLERV